MNPQFLTQRLLFIFSLLFLLIVAVNLNFFEEAPFIPPSKTREQIRMDIQRAKNLRAREKGSEVQIDPAVKARYALVPEDPAKYGMISYSKAKTPRTSEEWAYHYQKAFENNPVLQSEDGKKTLATMQKPREEYQKNMTDLDAAISQFESDLRSDPLDEKKEKQLQMLYKLKALGEVLQERVVIDPETGQAVPQPPAESPSVP